MKNEDLLKKRLKKGEVVIGNWCVIPSAPLSQVISSSGMDFIIIDMEHGPHSFETAAGMVRSARLEGCAPLIRVPANIEESILRALDIDASGVIVPHIESSEDAERAVSASKYFPLGSRGFSPFTAAGRFYPADVKDHSRVQNEKTFVGLILEGKKGLDSLDGILAVKDIEKRVDLIYVGAYDLSQALGIPGKVDDPAVKEALLSCVSKIKAKGIAAGGHVAKNRGDIEWMVKAGMQFITILPDCAVIHEAFSKYVKDLREISPS